MKRPELKMPISPEDFKEYYWSKEELVKFCSTIGLNAAGGKIEVADRIELFLATGKLVRTVGKTFPTSRFDWKQAELDLNTIITDNYKNTENVRAFMTLHIGPHFRFNTQFMIWAKTNAGKTLADAIDEWNRIYNLKRNKRQKAEIAPQFEYSSYIRDFMADNPGKTRALAIHFWKLKRRQRGDNNYSKTDLFLFEESIV